MSKHSLFFVLCLSFIAHSFLFSIEKRAFDKNYRIYLKNLFQNRTISFSGKVSFFHNKIKGNFQSEISFHSSDGYIDILYTSSFYRQEVHMDNSFRVLYSDTRYFVKPEAVKKVYGYDRRELINMTNFNQSALIYYYKGKITKKTLIDFDDKTLDEDALFLLLQASLIEGKQKEFFAEVLLASVGLKLPFRFSLKQTKDLTSLDPTLNYPPDFVKLASNRSKFAYVYEISLDGIAGLVYRQKHYLAFENEYPHNFIASWGGDPNNPEFIYRNP